MTIRSVTIRNCIRTLLAVMLGSGLTGGLAETSQPTAAADMSSTATVGDPMHLVVGRSMFFNTVNRLRRVYVSNPAILDSFTASPHQIVVTAKSPGVSSLILWDENGQSQVYLIASDVDVSELRHALRDALPSENIRAEGHEEDVSLAGTVSSPEAEQVAVKLAALFSKSVANSMLIAPQHARQVRLKLIARARNH
jgi:pilus assembly protein CpaC